MTEQATPGPPDLLDIFVYLRHALAATQWGNYAEGRELCPDCGHTCAEGHASSCSVGMALDAYTAYTEAVARGPLERQLAAAPELYAALRVAAEALDFAMPSQGSPLHAILASAHKQAEAAIAKAEGQEGQL